MTSLKWMGNAVKRVSYQRVAELPRLTPPNFVPTTFAQTINLTSGSSVDTAIAGITDTTGNVRIALEAGGTFAPFTMHKLPGTGYVVVDTEDVTPVLGPLVPLDPVTGRMTKAYATAYNLATILFNGTGFNGVGWNETPPDIPQRWVIRRLKVTAAAGSAMTSPLINVGESLGIFTPTVPTDLPAWIAVHQNLVLGVDDIGVAGAPKGCRVGIGFEGYMIRITGNWIENMHYGEYGEDGIYDAQAIRSFLGPGPALVENNFGEANSECIAFGGAGSLLGEGQLFINDYTCRYNHFYKRLSWKSTVGEGYTAAHAAGRHGCKNGVEQKQGRRVWWYGNVIENVWCDQQHGCGLLIYSIDQSQTATFLSAQDVTVEYNWLKNCFAALETIGTYPQPFSTLLTARITFRNNIATGLRDPSLYSDTYSGDPNIAGALTFGNVDNVHFEHNTMLVNDFSNPWGIETFDADVRIVDGWTFKDSIILIPNNVVARVWTDARQISAGGFVTGDFTLTTASTWDYNLGCDPQAGGVTHPTGAGHTNDIWVTTQAGLGLVNAARAFDLSCTLAQLSDLKPAVGTPGVLGYLSASDGTNRGADVDTIQTVLASVRAADADLPT